MKAFDKLVTRAQVIKLGPDQVLLAFAIAWIAKFKLQMNTELQLVALETSRDHLMANYEGVLLGLDDEDFANSDTRKRIRLQEVAKLLRSGPLQDLALGAGTPERDELLERFEVLMAQAQMLFAHPTEDFNDLDSSVFVLESVAFQKWLMSRIDERLKSQPLLAWAA